MSSIAASDVGSPFAGRFQHGHSRGVGIDDKQRFVCMSIVGESGKVFDDSIAVRGTCNNTGHIVGFEQFLHDGFVGDAFFFGNHFQIYPVETGVGFDNFDDSGIQCSGKQ